MRPLLLALGAGLLAGCASTTNTLPPVASANERAAEYVLDIPDGLDIRWVDYEATAAGNVAGTVTDGVGGATSTSIYGRAFVKVFAVERETGEEVLLVYENLRERSAPIQVIRFRRQPAERARR